MHMPNNQILAEKYGKIIKSSSKSVKMRGLSSLSIWHMGGILEQLQPLCDLAGIPAQLPYFQHLHDYIQYVSLHPTTLTLRETLVVDFPLQL